MQNGTSAGTNAALMKKVVAKLSEDDIIALSAYLGSLSPGGNSTATAKR
jgi:cytochrome c553